MSPSSNTLEKQFYPIVLNYLSTHGYITHSYKHDGAALPFIGRGYNQLVVDVFGIKGDTDLRTRRIEAVAVEVKRTKARTSLRYIAQAESYSKLAHRCYLAQPYDFSLKAKSGAAHAGVGLLRIRGSKVELVAESKQFEPDPVSLESFLNRSLRIRQCSVCLCYQFRYPDASSGNKGGGGHWRRDDLVHSRSKRNKLSFLCADCEVHWASSKMVKKLINRIDHLEKRLKTLAASYDRLKARL
jgi:hypothetical protein